MKKSDQSDRGIALVIILVMMLIATASVGALMGYSSRSSEMTRRALDFQRAQIAAEAGLDYGVDQLLGVMRNYQFSLSRAELQSVVDQIPPPPTLDDYKYVTPDGRTPAFKISIVDEVEQGVFTDGNFPGSLGRFQHIEVTCGAYNPKTGVGSVLRQRLRALSLFLIRFGVFYELDLEILPGPAMRFTGPVHSNTDMYLGGPLEFYDRLTAAGSIYHKRKDADIIHGNAQIMNDSGNLASMIQDGTILDSSDPEWMTQSLNRWNGRVKTSAHAVSNLDPPIDPTDEPHDLIERGLPETSPDYDDLTESEKFANKAALRIHVDAAGNFSAVDYNGTDVTERFTEAELIESGTYNGKPLYAKEGNGSYEMDTEGSYTVDRTFVDQREAQVMAPVDIYVDRLLEEFPELVSGTTYGAAQGRGLVYVTRDDPDGPGGLQPAVRIRNGQELPNGGLSIASDLPTYVEGNYNVSGDTKPALIAGDAVTMLSENWQDGRSAADINTRVAQNTAFNTVVMTGNSPTIPESASTSGAYNGGLENVLRFLEKWSGQTVSFRGSIIDIWHSEIADGDWSYGSYYTAPNRDWGYDEMYRTTAPPGMPRVFGIEELAWARSTWADVGWDN